MSDPTPNAIRPETAEARIVADDQDLSERVERVVEQRDSFREIASTIIATITLDRNTAHVHPELRDLCEKVWKPSFYSAVNGTELTDEQIDYALAAHAIDMDGAHKKIKALIEKHPAPSPPPSAGSAEERLREEAERHKSALEFYADEQTWVSHAFGYDKITRAEWDKGNIARAALAGK